MTAHQLLWIQGNSNLSIAKIIATHILQENKKINIIWYSSSSNLYSLHTLKNNSKFNQNVGKQVTICKKWICFHFYLFSYLNFLN